MPDLCAKCGQAILWHKTANNKDLAVDADPSPNGNLHIGGPTPVLVPTERGRRYKRLHRAHVVTCPYSVQRYLI